jgi:hypothetical protein
MRRNTAIAYCALWVAPYRVEIFEVIDSRHPPDWVTEFGDDGERYSYPAPLNEASVAGWSFAESGMIEYKLTGGISIEPRKELIAQSRVIAKGERIRDVQSLSISMAEKGQNGLRKAVQCSRAKECYANIIGMSIMALAGLKRS